MSRAAAMFLCARIAPHLTASPINSQFRADRDVATSMTGGKGTEPERELPRSGSEHPAILRHGRAS